MAGGRCQGFQEYVSWFKVSRIIYGESISKAALPNPDSSMGILLFSASIVNEDIFLILRGEILHGEIARKVISSQ